MRKFSLFATACALAVGAFWATMFTSPPTSKAQAASGINVRELTLKAHLEAGQSYDAF